MLGVGQFRSAGFERLSGTRIRQNSNSGGTAVAEPDLTNLNAPSNKGKPSVQDRVIATVSTFAKPANSQGIELTTRLQEDLGLDSLDKIELLSSIENSLRLTRIASNEELSKIKTVGELVAYASNSN